MSKISKLMAALFAIALAAQVHASVVLQTSGYKLTGATGIEVGGKLYNVMFSGGSCATLFGGCDDVSDFTFQTAADARAASQALLDHVFLNLIHQFDTLPNNTEGCSNPIVCNVVTPFAIARLLLVDPIRIPTIGNPLPRDFFPTLPGGGDSFNLVTGAYAVNSANESDDGVDVRPVLGQMIVFIDPSNPVEPASFQTYAIWVEQPAATVPEPSSVALIASGIMGLAAVRRRRNIQLTD